MKKWKKLEWYIAGKFKELGDKFARPTKGSGNGNENYDIYTSFPYAVEAKERNTKNITINIDVWNKNKASIPLNNPKVPILFLENKDGKRFLVMEADDWFDLLSSFEQIT